MKLRLLEIGRVARAKGLVTQHKLKQRYRQLLDATGRVVGQAKRFSEEIVRGVKRSTNASKQPVLEGLRQEQCFRFAPSAGCHLDLTATPSAILAARFFNPSRTRSI